MPKSAARRGIRPSQMRRAAPLKKAARASKVTKCMGEAHGRGPVLQPRLRRGRRMGSNSSIDDPATSFVSTASDPRLTEQRNPRSAGIDQLDTLAIVDLINAEDRQVAVAVGRE